MTGINARHESSFAYDAAWAIALVLNASAQRLAGRFRKELVYRLVDSFGRVGKSADLVSRAIFSTNGRQKLSMFLKKTNRQQFLMVYTLMFKTFPVISIVNLQCDYCSS